MTQPLLTDDMLLELHLLSDRQVADLRTKIRKSIASAKERQGEGLPAERHRYADRKREWAIKHKLTLAERVS